jgi:RNA polymerase sigma-70 factor (ECF subfamily)
MSVDEERALLVGIAAGADEAVSAFDQRIRPRLISFARRKGLTREEAEDVAQDSLLAAYTQLKQHKYKGTGSIQAWINSIFGHHVSDVLRRRYRERRALISLGDIEDPVGFDPEECRRVRDALIEMPARERVVLLLSIQGGKPAREIATFLNLGTKTTEAILTKARKHFRELLGQPQENRRAKRLKERASS